MIPCIKSRLVGLLAALFVVVCAVQSAPAAGIGFRNDLRPIQPVIVQGATAGGDMIRRGQPLLLFPGRVAWDNRLDPGVRIISIYDANQPTRVLYRRPLEFVGQDIHFSIQHDNFGNIILVPVPVLPFMP